MSAWIRKHGEGNLQLDILDLAVSREHLDTLEIHWISLMRALGFADLNVLDGGGGAMGYSPTREQVERVASQLRGRAVPPEQMGRRMEGRERLGVNKIRMADVPRIRERLVAGDSIGILASDYSVTPQAIYAIKTGKSWARINEDGCYDPSLPARREAITSKPITRMRGKRRPAIPWSAQRRRFTNEQLEEICAEYSRGGLSRAELSRKYSISPSRISDYVNGWRYMD